MTTMTATDARKSFFDLLKCASERHEIYHIQYRSGNVVLMSQAEFDSLQETLELLSTPGFRENFEIARREVASGDTVSFEEAFGDEP